MTEMKEDLAAVKEKVDSLSKDLEEHKNKTTTQLVDMNSKLDSLDSKQDGLSMTVTTVNSELEHNVLTNVTKELKKTADYIVEHLSTCASASTYTKNSKDKEHMGKQYPRQLPANFIAQYSTRKKTELLSLCRVGSHRIYSTCPCCEC